MWSRMKSALGTLFSITGKVVFSAGSVLGQAGSTLFSAQNNIEYFLKTRSPTVEYIVPVPAIFASVFVALVTKVLPINRRFGKSSVEAAPISLPAENEEKEKCCGANKCGCQCDPALNCVGKTINYGLNTCGMFSGVFSSGVRFLNGLVLGETIAMLTKSDLTDPNQEWKNNVILAGAAVLALSNFIAYYYFYYAAIKKNSKAHALTIQNRDFTWDKYKTLTVCAVSFPLAAAVPLGYFSMNRAMARMPFVETLPNNVKQGIAGISSFTQLTAMLSSSVTELHNRISGKVEHNYHADNNPCWEPALRWNTYTWGALDSGIGGAGTFVAIMLTCNELLGTDLYNPYLMGFAGVCGLGIALLSFIFVMKGYDDILEFDIHGKNHGNEYQPIPDIENPETPDEVPHSDNIPTPDSIGYYRSIYSRSYTTPTFFGDLSLAKNAELSRSVPEKKIYRDDEREIIPIMG